MQTGRMSRMRTSFASLLWARPAMRRACSSGVRAGSGPFFAASLAAVEAEPRDLGGHGGRHQFVDRLTPRDPVAHLAGRDRDGLELEEADALRVLEPLEHAVEPLARIARTGGDGDRRELEDAVRVLPVEEVAELVGADQEHGVAEAAVAEHVDGALVLVELDATVREGGAREAKPVRGVELDPLVARALGDEDDEVVEGELLLGGARQRDVAVVRRVERPAEETDHAYSTISSPRSISSPRFAPAALSAASSSSSPGSSPTTRKPRSVR